MEPLANFFKTRPRLSVAASISTFIIAMFVLRAFSFTKQDAAAWVQAVGSILAILGAFSLANIQHKKEISDREQERINQRILVAHQIKHLILFASWPHAPSPTSFTTEQKLDLAKKLEVEAQERFLQRFESFPILEVKDPMPITQMSRMSTNWYEGIRLMKRARQLALAGDDAWESAFDELISFPPHSAQVMGNLDKYATQVWNRTYQGYEVLQDIRI